MIVKDIKWSCISRCNSTKGEKLNYINAMKNPVNDVNMKIRDSAIKVLKKTYKVEL